MKQNEKDRLAAAKKQLWSTLSDAKYNAAADTTPYKDISNVIKQNQSAVDKAKADWTATLQGRGASDTTRDITETNTSNGTPFLGQQGRITSRGRDYMELLAEQQSNTEPTSVPAVDGSGNWSTGQDIPFDSASASADLIKMHTRRDGSIDKKSAQKYFLHVEKDGSQPDHYAQPLAVVHPVSQQPIFHAGAIDAAWKNVDGSMNGIASYPHQSKLIRIKKRNKLPLNEDQKSYIMRHNGSVLNMDTDLE